MASRWFSREEFSCAVFARCVSLTFAPGVLFSLSRNKQSFFTHRRLKGFAGINAGPNEIARPALALSGHFLGLASAVWNQVEFICFAFLVCRAGSQTGASQLGGPDDPRHDELPLCRIQLAQSNSSMCRHDRWGISWSLAGRVIRLETGSIPALYLHHSGDCRLQISASIRVARCHMHTTSWD